MNIINFSKRKFQSLELFNPGNTINNTECKLYIVNKKGRLLTEEKDLLKYYFLTEGEYFGKKLLNVQTLIDSKNIINMEELVFPSALASVNEKIVGYTMPFYEQSTNLQLILQNPNITLTEKIKYLKDIGGILEKLSKLKDFKHKIHIGDLHEANFIFDHKSQKLLVVDTDSFYITNNKPFVSKYLILNPNMGFLEHKYHIDDEQFFIPDENSDLFCYIIIILNTLSQSNINNLTTDTFYLYLSYLSDLKFPHELLDCFANIYIGSNNTNPKDLLELIPNTAPQAHKLVFKARTGITL